MYYDRDMLYIGQIGADEKLYHYTTIDALINIVSRKELWVSKWDYLNDIDEFKVAVDACVEVLKEEKIKPEIIADVVNGIGDDLHSNSMPLDYFILSLAYEEQDSQLLWSSYSNYDGVNFEIDPVRFIESINHKMIWHGLVNYNFKSQMECLRKTFYDEFIDVVDYGHIKSLNEINGLVGRQYEMFISHISIICGIYAIFFKRACFEGEKEYRFVFSNASDREIDFRCKNGMVLPYIKKTVENIDFITGITIGPTNQIDIAAKGINELLHYYQRDVDIKKSNIPLRF